MRPSHRINLIKAIASEMQKRYDMHEASMYFEAFKIEVPRGNYGDYDGVEEFTKFGIAGLSDDWLLRVGEDLEINDAAVFSRGGNPPRNWPDDKKFRLFISHISRDKKYATRLRDCLTPYNISAFVAHEDIKPTAGWAVEIERALRTMDAFLSIHTDGFCASFWTQ